MKFLKEILDLVESDEMKIDPSQIKTRKRVSGYGLLGTKYKKKPKYRDKPRQKKVKDY